MKKFFFLFAFLFVSCVPEGDPGIRTIEVQDFEVAGVSTRDSMSEAFKVLAGASPAFLIYSSNIIGYTASSGISVYGANDRVYYIQQIISTNETYIVDSLLGKYPRYIWVPGQYSWEYETTAMRITESQSNITIIAWNKTYISF